MKFLFYSCTMIHITKPHFPYFVDSQKIKTRNTLKSDITNETDANYVSWVLIPGSLHWYMTQIPLYYAYINAYINASLGILKNVPKLSYAPNPNLNISCYYDQNPTDQGLFPTVFPCLHFPGLGHLVSTKCPGMAALLLKLNEIQPR